MQHFLGLVCAVKVEEAPFDTSSKRDYSFKSVNTVVAIYYNLQAYMST